MRSIKLALLSTLFSIVAFSQCSSLAINPISGKLNCISAGTSGPPSGAAGGDLGSTYPNPTVIGINSTLLSGLATGILKNTTATGVPSIAVASDVVGLFTSCSGTKLLAANGTCITGGAGTVAVVGAGNLTSTACVTGGGSQTIQTPSDTCTIDASGNISTSGTVSTGVGGGVAGGLGMKQGTASSAPANSFGFLAPTSVTTPYLMKFPGAPTTGLVLTTGTTDPTTVTFVAPAANKVIGGATPLAITVTSAYVDNSIALTGTDINTSNQVTATHLAAALPVNQGGSATTSTLVGVMRGGNPFTAAELSGDATTSGSNVVTNVKIPPGVTLTGTPSSGQVPTATSTTSATWQTPSGSGGSAGATIFSTTASVAVTQTSATTLIGAVSGSTTLVANTFTAGQVLHFTAQGFYSTPATPANLTIDLKIGGSIRITTGAVTQIASITNGVWKLDCDVTTRTTGASGTQIANCIFNGTGATITPGEAPMFVNTTWTIDTTATAAIDLQATWSTAVGSPTITSTNIAAWIPGAPVTSVFTRTGAVVATSGDYTCAQVTNCPTVASTVQRFTGTGTYTPTAGMVWAEVEIVGGGGGSGGCAALTTTAQVCIAGGGGGGGYAKVILTAAQVGASQAITIGAAGTAGSAGANAGGAGGTTSIGSLISCTGGALGTAGSATAASATATTGLNGTCTVSTGTLVYMVNAVVGDVGYVLSSGTASTAVQAWVRATGGATPFGKGGAQDSLLVNATATHSAASASPVATSFGAGACGPVASESSGTSVAAAGGAAGIAGIVIVTEYF